MEPTRCRTHVPTGALAMGSPTSFASVTRPSGANVRTTCAEPVARPPLWHCSARLIARKTRCSKTFFLTPSGIGEGLASVASAFAEGESFGRSGAAGGQRRSVQCRFP